MSSGDARYTGLRSQALIGGPGGPVRGRLAIWILAVVAAFAVGFLVGYLVGRAAGDEEAEEPRAAVGSARPGFAAEGFRVSGAGPVRPVRGVPRAA